MESAPLNISYAPPKGNPLGNNASFAIASRLVIPLINLVSKHNWQGSHNIPKSGPVIVCCNHISYFDPLVFAHFLYKKMRKN
jgi:1-acyl-sn-glycerol-3-phosphate acyltransferase